MRQGNGTLFERVGGEETVRLLVLKLYDKILQDELLLPFFENVNVERLRASQHAFIMMALGGPHQYTGRSLENAHRPLVERGLGDSHFNAVKQHMLTSMKELGIAETCVMQAMQIIEATRSHVLCRSKGKT